MPMWQPPTTVIARFTPFADRKDDLVMLLTGMLRQSRAEPGCRFYDLYATGDDFVLLEQYVDRLALEAHRATIHYRAYRSRLADLLAKDIDVTVLEPVDIGWSA
jgi:quinol monooxygenase YgiN